MANPKIQLRHDTATNWTTVNPILLEGEVGIETDTKKFKIGDGVNDWNTLEYMTTGGQGASDYTELTNLPSINNTTLTGNKTGDNLNLATTWGSRDGNLSILARGATFNSTLTEGANNVHIGSWLGINGSYNVDIGITSGAANGNVARSYSIAIGANAKYNASNAIQLGSGTNSTANSLQVRSYQLLNTTTGLIPDERLSTNIARVSNIPSTSDFLNRSGTNADYNFTVNELLIGQPASYLNHHGIKSTLSDLKLIGESYSGDVIVGDDSIAKANPFFSLGSFGNPTKGVTFFNTNYLNFMKDLSTVGIQTNISYDDSNSKCVVDFTTPISGYDVDVRVNGNSLVNTLMFLTYLQDYYTPNTVQPLVDGQWVYSYYQIANNVSVSEGQTYEYSLASYLPNDNYNYEVYYSITGITNPTTNSIVDLRISSSIINTTLLPTVSVITRTNSFAQGSNCATIPVGTDRKIYVKIAENNTNISGTFNMFRVAAYRRIGTNT